MSLFGSLYLFEQLRGNCVTLSVEDVLWQRTRWTEGTSRGSVAIINEGYFPQHSQTLCMRGSAWVFLCFGGVCMCLMWGPRRGDEPLYLQGIQLWDAHWGRRHPLLSFLLVWIVSVIYILYIYIFFIWKISFGITKGNFLALTKLTINAGFRVSVQW